mmetsp:Transcript_23259/g.17679  ORF Transcript_23259/g.17679 Transcript_23259/m.17679 type:complete len:109 (+) Transcript_23259:48-374(+)
MRQNVLLLGALALLTNAQDDSWTIADHYWTAEPCVYGYYDTVGSAYVFQSGEDYVSAGSFYLSNYSGDWDVDGEELESSGYIGMYYGGSYGCSHLNWVEWSIDVSDIT